MVVITNKHMEAQLKTREYCKNVALSYEEK